MQHRILALIPVCLICLSLIGATPAAISQDYAIVDDNPMTVRGYYLTIGAALQSNATTIEVREGAYPESVTIDRPLTLLCREGATLVNDGLSVSIRITAAAVSVKGCAIEGNHAGGDIGGHDNGTGIKITAPHAHIDGLITRNLKSFSVLAVGIEARPDEVQARYLPEMEFIETGNAYGLLLENYAFYNVATDPNTPLLAQYAIHLNGVDDSVIRNGYAEGHSQAAGLWYHADNNRAYGNRFVNNYGYVGTVGNYIPRSVFENYGVTDAENNNNWFYDNEIDGGRGGIELADILNDTVVRNNLIRNTESCFVVLGSGTNHSTNLTIEGNHCYGNGQPNQASNHITGKHIRIVDNWFYDYHNDNVGTLYVWGGQAEDIVIDENTFLTNGTTVRVSEGDVIFRGNSVLDNLSNLYFRIDGTAAAVAIDNNRFEGVAACIDSNGASDLTITDNTVFGCLWLHNQTRNAIVRGNTVTTPGMWGIGLYMPTESVVTNNRISAWNPVHFQPGATNYSKLSDNFLTNENGGAVGLPTCSGTNTCSNNWTVGQVPPIGTD